MHTSVLDPPQGCEEAVHSREDRLVQPRLGHIVCLPYQRGTRWKQPADGGEMHPRLQQTVKHSRERLAKCPSDISRIVLTLNQKPR
jgi:hypothetical protein